MIMLPGFLMKDDTAREILKFESGKRHAVISDQNYEVAPSMTVNSCSGHTVDVAVCKLRRKELRTKVLLRRHVRLGVRLMTLTEGD
jgi:hypothetical protein